MLNRSRNICLWGHKAVIRQFSICTLHFSPGLSQESVKGDGRRRVMPLVGGSVIAEQRRQNVGWILIELWTL